MLPWPKLSPCSRSVTFVLLWSPWISISSSFVSGLKWMMKSGSYQMDGLLFCQGHASWWYWDSKIRKEGLILWGTRVRTANGQDVVVQIGPNIRLCKIVSSDGLPFAVSLSVLLPLWVKEVVFVDVFNLRLVQHAWCGWDDKSPVDPGEKIDRERYLLNRSYL